MGIEEKSYEIWAINIALEKWAWHVHYSSTCVTVPKHGFDSCLQSDQSSERSVEGTFTSVKVAGFNLEVQIFQKLLKMPILGQISLFFFKNGNFGSFCSNFLTTAKVQPFEVRW